MAIGNIDEVIDSLQWSAVDQYILRAAHATGDVFIIAGRIATGIWVWTITADADGLLAYVDAQQIDTCTLGSVGGIVHIDGDVYCLAYLKNDGPGDDGPKIATFPVDAAGNIGAVVSTFIFAVGATVNQIYRPDICHISGTFYAVVYTDGLTSDGWLATISIAPDGTIAGAITSSWEFDAVRGLYPHIYNTSGSIFAIMYSNNTFNGLLLTVEINALGVIQGVPPIDWKLFSLPEYQWGGNMFHIDGTYWALVYQGGVGGDSWITTASIDALGNITIIQRWQFNPGPNAILPWGIVLHDNALATGKIIGIVCGADAGDSALFTIEVTNQGDIIRNIINSEALSTTRFTRYQIILNIHDQLFLIVYSNGLPPIAPGWAETRLLSALTTSSQAAREVQSYSSILDGVLTYDEDLACEGRFEYGETPAMGRFTSWQVGLSDGDWFSEDLDPIAPGRTYYYRAQGRSPSGITSGERRTFQSISLADSSPVVATREATDISTYFATLHGLVAFDGFELCNVRFQYGLTTAYGMVTPWQFNLSTGDVFEETIEELAEGQGFHFRAELVDKLGRHVYGADRSLSTLSESGALTGLDTILVGVLAGAD